MNALCSRRSFLTGSLAGALLLGERQLLGAAGRGKTLDMHVHLMGQGDAGTGCRMGPQLTGKWWFGYLVKKMGIYCRARTFDEGYLSVLVETVLCSGIDKVVLIAMDSAYQSNGQPDWKMTSLYVPNDYLFQVVARYPDKMVPCVGLNPDRPDWLDEMERCHAKGARMLKIYPPMHGIDLLDKRYAKFFRRCHELGMVVLVHTGHSQSLKTYDVGHGNPSPRKLALALEKGCTVVAQHSGTSGPCDRPDFLPDFLTMIRKYPNLWGDTAALATKTRRGDLFRLLADDVAPERLLFGTDFPIPPSPLAFRRQIGLLNALRLIRNHNSIARNYALQNLLGIGRPTAERAYRFVQRIGGV